MWAFQGTAHAGEPPRQILFPVVGEASWQDDFGDPRGNGSHDGNDILAERRAPVVAVEAGRVSLWTTSWRAGCMLYLHGNSGTTYFYVHLNNDLTAGNDNRGGCVEGVAYAPGLKDGQRVAAGELIGFVGNSGDADGNHPHLHFELHPAGGAAVSPNPWLKKARRLLFPAPAGGGEVELAAVRPLTLALYGTVQEAAQGMLTVRLQRLRMSNGWRVRASRDLVLAVPADARLERAVEGKRRNASLEGVEVGERIVVWTGTIAPGLAAQLGEPGALAAAQVLFRGTV